MPAFTYRFVKPTWDGDGLAPGEWQEITDPQIIEQLAQELAADERARVRAYHTRSEVRTKLVRAKWGWQ